MTIDGISIRTYSDDDYDFVYSQYSEIENIHLWQQDRFILSKPEFYDYFRTKVLDSAYCFFIAEIETDQTKQKVGFTYMYKHSLVDGIGFLCVLIDQQFVKKRIGQIVGFLLVDYIFRTLPFRKLYSEVFDFNKPSQKIQESNGFVLEAKLKDYRYYDGMYTDLLIFSLTKEAFFKVRPNFTDTKTSVS